MALDEPSVNEAPIQVNGLDVLISDKDKRFTDRSLLDYIKSPEGEGFTISTGNSSCGSSDCGSSSC